MKVLVLGVTGMLGSTVFRQFHGNPHYEVWGTLRNPGGARYFSEDMHSSLISNVDVLDQDSLVSVLARVKPDVVINCVGLIKQLADAKDPLSALPINAMLPHRIAKLCTLSGSRLIHISTDCVFSGRKGMYTEEDISDAEDLYGKSKYIGELHDELNAITLRTSIIGHELGSQYSLVDWFLSQNAPVKGYEKAIFSGLPTAELARVIRDYVIPNPGLHGLYHVSVAPIDKLSLLKMVAKVYEKEIDIIADSQVSIDRSLNSSKFQAATGYVPPSWLELVKSMRALR
ncbi:NAD(P)-dependent oxidoreductase [Stutzerimonas stutzeri]|jgi:dTDP-4-dehydrorhamnose reductase|uniref:dTDP-4-dehydrorhamnose reductase family protein n=1 Tax=unclassified Pseudomonas TaxID=196821 RepID=UPI000BB39BC3|nr:MULTISPECIES: SDR family oxidoreductase [unclassified Pseudomonas]AZO91458.1 NAD(P)-dependent oxidoreductase [Stutzerimonas stutzeri]PBJ04301.1 dTDP-4-dehydrorhamnose reductase [Pseudomonas sp. ACN5]PMZ75397.1 SDR family NAD(P)-dependent oxidoreductase [Pseudomonas sp. FW305-70]